MHSIMLHYWFVNVSEPQWVVLECAAHAFAIEQPAESSIIRP